VSTWFFKPRRNDTDGAGRAEASAGGAAGAAAQPEMPGSYVGDSVEVHGERGTTIDDSASMGDDTITLAYDAHITSDNHGE